MRKIFALTTVLLSAMAFAGCSSGGGGGTSTPPPPGPVGPISSVNGFPTYYRDPAGLFLALCSPNDALCLADPVIPGNPYSVQIGMGGEAFYWKADASVPVAAGGVLTTGGSAELVLAMEAAFGGAGAPAAGQQMTFSRLRIRVDVTTAGTYTITHPYGQVSFAVTTPGVDAIIDLVAAPIVPGSDTTATPISRIGDVGCAVVPFGGPCDFNIALNGATFPFLVWDPAVGPAAPAGYIGVPLNPHPVVGSPTGNNFFRVQGPAGSNLSGTGSDVIETNLFTVSGKKL